MHARNHEAVSQPRHGALFAIQNYKQRALHMRLGHLAGHESKLPEVACEEARSGGSTLPLPTGNNANVQSATAGPRYRRVAERQFEALNQIEPALRALVALVGRGAAPERCQRVDVIAQH